jgi:lysine-N-methylase
MNTSYGAVIRSSISMEGEPHFQLSADDRCPHLDERGLCKIILNEGEHALCRICREHPRFYNFTTVAEVGLGLSCPEAARIVLSSPDFAIFEEIGQADAEPDCIAFDGRAEREKVYAILQNDYPTALTALYGDYGIDRGEDALWLNRIDSLEYLNADHKSLFMNYSSALRPQGADEFLRRFLAYLVFRHCTEAEDPEDFRLRLSFCLFCERLLASLIRSEKAASLREIATLASILSEEIEYSDENTFALTYLPSGS